MARGLYGYPGQGADVPAVQPKWAKLLDHNLVGRRYQSTAGVYFEWMMPKNIISLKVMFSDVLFSTGVATITFGLYNSAGTAAPAVGYTIDGFTTFTQFGACMDYMIGGRINAVSGHGSLGGTAIGGGGYSSGIVPVACSNLAATAPVVDRFRFYFDNVVTITQGSLIMFGLFR